MQLRALSAEGVVGALGVALDDSGLPTRRELASRLRLMVQLRGAVTTVGATSLLATLSSPDHPDDPRLQRRIGAVIELMVMAGDLQRADLPEGETLWTRQTRYVNAVAGETVAIGSEPVPEEIPGQSGSFVRHVPHRTDAASLALAFGPPRFREHLGQLGGDGQNGSLTDYLRSAQAAARLAISTGSELDAGSISWTTADQGAGALGATSAGAPVFGMPATDSRMLVALPTPEHGQWLALGIDGLSLIATEPDLGFPQQMRALLAVAATPLNDDLRAWSLSPALHRSLLDWLSEPLDENATSEEDGPQIAIETALANQRLMVEAGPGAGKTRVACGRIARLIEQGVSPSRIWMISFTRVATQELRERIASFLDDPNDARDISIWTLDAAAARLRQYDASPVSGGGFDAGIQATLDLLESGNRGLLGYLSTLEHLVIDEVQDLSPTRAQLALALIRRLHRQCGITLFQDSAQAIYGSRRRETAESRGGDLSSLLVAEPGLGFKFLQLDRDYRTRTPSLAAMKSRLRAELLDPGAEAVALYTSVRGQIERFAASSGSVEAQLPSPSAMVLYRSRFQLFRAAARFWERGFRFRVRMSGSPPVVEPWIGALLGGVAVEELSRADFDALWDELWPRPRLENQDAWSRLRALAGGSGQLLSLAKLRLAITAASPPRSIARDELGRGGALLSTIHGVKGREAEHVVIALPRQPRDETRLAEEARVLFVAATRARTSLSLAPGGAVHAEPLDSGRYWSSSKSGRARVEIGRPEDVDAKASVIGLAHETAQSVADRQKALWRASEIVTPLKALRRSAGGFELVSDVPGQDQVSLGFLAPQFERDLFKLRDRLAPGGYIGSTIRGLFLAGVRTVCVEPGDPAPPVSGLVTGLAAIVIGAPEIYFNQGRTSALAAVLEAS